MTLNVYEAINWTLKEQFICTTPLSIKALAARCQAAPPRAVAHWSFDGHDIVWTEIEDGLPDHDARTFAGIYAGTMHASGWRIVTDD